MIAHSCLGLLPGHEQLRMGALLTIWISLQPLPMESRSDHREGTPGLLLVAHIFPRPYSQGRLAHTHICKWPGLTMPIAEILGSTQPCGSPEQGENSHMWSKRCHPLTLENQEAQA